MIYVCSAQESYHIVMNQFPGISPLTFYTSVQGAQYIANPMDVRQSFIVCLVSPGRIQPLIQEPPAALNPGCSSYYIVRDMKTGKPLADRDVVFRPDLHYDEFVLYDATRVIPLFLVECEDME